MTATQLRYATTRDGARIAFTAMGEGPNLLVVENTGLSSTILAAGGVGFVSRLANRRRVLLFDFPGTGSSRPGKADMSLNAQISYLEAVAKSSSTPGVDVYAWGPSAAPAAAFAARFPTLVRRLVLANPCIAFRDLEAHSPIVRMLSLASSDFKLFSTTMLSLLGMSPTHQSGLRDALVEATPREVVRTWLDAISGFDASEDLPKIQAPTLVLQARTNPLVPAQHVASIAARIPNALLEMVESAPLGGMLGENLDMVVDFLDGRTGAPPRGRPRVRGRLKIIAFTDIEHHTQMMQRLGDPQGRAVLREHDRLTAEWVYRHGGSIVKSQGDGFMVSFDSAESALEWATDIQRGFSARGGELLKVRIGLNAGEPISENDDFFGSSVITAARVAAQARGGQVFVTNVVRELASGKGFLFEDRGNAQLRGIDEPVRLFELRWSENT